MTLFPPCALHVQVPHCSILSTYTNVTYFDLVGHRLTLALWKPVSVTHGQRKHAYSLRDDACITPVYRFVHAHSSPLVLVCLLRFVWLCFVDTAPCLLLLLPPPIPCPSHSSEAVDLLFFTATEGDEISLCIRLDSMVAYPISVDISVLAARPGAWINFEEAELKVRWAGERGKMYRDAFHSVCVWQRLCMLLVLPQLDLAVSH